MKNFFKVAFLALVAFICSVNAQVPAPNIYNIAYYTEDTARITWSTDQNITPTRFRIQVTADDATTAVEWPSQINRVAYDSEDAPYKQMATKSNFECFNQCIQDPECNFVVRSSEPTGDNCFLKKDASKITNATVQLDSEYAVIKAYSNWTYISFLSPYQQFKIKMAVYDSKQAAWSAFSQESYYTYPTGYALPVTFVRTGVTAGSLTWQEGTSLTFSRFGALLSANQSDYTEFTDVDTSTLTTFQHPTGYFYIKDYSQFIVANDEQTCIDACFNKFECVQLVYFSEDYKSSDGTTIASKNSCYLNSQMNIANGIYMKSNVTVLSVKDTRAEIKLNKTEFGSWRFLVEGWTQYGVKTNRTGYTNYNITDASPVLVQLNMQYLMNITWGMPEPLSLKRAALYYTLNNSDATKTYSFTASSDFNDPNEKTVNASSFNECFESCYNSLACLAYTFDPAQSKCFLKTKTDKPIDCVARTTCGIFPENVVYDWSLNPFVNTLYNFYAYATTSFDYTTPPGRLIGTSLQVKVEIRQVDTFYPGRSARLSCSPRDYNGKINWYKNFEPLDLKALNGELSDDKTTVTFYNVTSRLHNGVYNCENILNNSQLLVSDNYVTVQVNETVPPTVYFINATLTGTKDKPSIFIQWTPDPFSLSVDCMNLYYSNDTQNFNNKTYCSPSLAGGSIMINEAFDCKVTFKFQLKNSIGTSTMSNTFQIPSQECQESPQTNPPKTYFGGFIAAICVAGVLLIVAVGLIINKCNSRR